MHRWLDVRTSLYYFLRGLSVDLGKIIIWYHCSTFTTTCHSCEPLEGISIIYEGPGIVDPVTIIMIPAPSSDSQDRRVVAKKYRLHDRQRSVVDNTGPS